MTSNIGSELHASAALGSVPSTSSAAYAARSIWLTAFDRFASAVTRGADSPVASARRY